MLQRHTSSIPAPSWGDGASLRPHAEAWAERRLVLACVLRSEDRYSIIHAVGDTGKIHWLPDAHTLARATAAHPPVAVILDLDVVGKGVHEVLEVLGRSLRPIPTLLRFSLNHRTANEVVILRPAAVDLRLSLHGFDSLDRDVRGLLSTPSHGLPELNVMARLIHTSGPDLTEVLVGVALIGGYNATVNDLARCCCSSARRLQERLLAAHMPSPKHLLMWVLYALTVWRITKLGWTLKQAAQEAGCASADALSKRMARFAGMRGSAPEGAPSFEDALEWLDATIMRERSSACRSGPACRASFQ